MNRNQLGELLTLILLIFLNLKSITEYLEIEGNLLVTLQLLQDRPHHHQDLRATSPSITYIQQYLLIFPFLQI